MQGIESQKYHIASMGSRRERRLDRLNSGSNYSPWQPLGIPSTIAPLGPSNITPLGQLYQSPPSPIPGDLGRGPSHQSHVLEHRDTYGQAQVCSKGHKGSSIDRPCQPSFCWMKRWHVRNPLPQSIRLSLFD